VHHPLMLLVAPAWCAIVYAVTRQRIRAMWRRRASPSGIPMSDATLRRTTGWIRTFAVVTYVLGVALAVVLAIP
jgi:hypothetical protein